MKSYDEGYEFKFLNEYNMIFEIRSTFKYIRNNLARKIQIL